MSLRGTRIVGALLLALAGLLVFASLEDRGESTSPELILSMELQDGRPVAAMANSQERRAIVVYNAKYCFACSSDLVLWKELSEKAPGRVFILFAGPMTPADLRIVAMKRIPVAGYLRGGAWADSEIPAEYIVQNGEIVRAAFGPDQVSRLRLWRRLLDTTVTKGTH